nr:peptidase, M50 family protein [Pseudopedobacter sp.]
MNSENLKLIPVLSENIKFNRLGSKEYILCNNFNKHYLKINADVYNLILLIDGVSDIESIAFKFSSQKSKIINPEKIFQLIYLYLAKYGVLKGCEGQIKPFTKPSYLNLSFIIINERILSKFVKLFYFLFNKTIAIFTSLFCLGIIISLLIFNFNIYQSFDLQKSLLTFIIVMAFSVTFHEIGHATSASFFGAKHGGIGGGFYLFTPVYFADVTDIWSLNKKQRIIVNIAGMYFELIFCAILALIALLIKNELLMITSIIVCLHTLFNLNPFLRSDGFWILSDLTNKPNLFFHAFNKVKDLLRFIKGQRIKKWLWVDFLLFFYGMISLTFILLFLFYVLVKNPNSIIYFPQNIFLFFKDIFKNDSRTSLVELGKLTIPLIFYYILINFCKKTYYSYFRKNSN